MGTAQRLRLAMVVSLASYVLAVLLGPGTVPGWVRDLVLGNLTCVLATVVLFHRAWTRRAARASVVTLAFGVGAFALGSNLMLLSGAPGGAAATVLSDLVFLASAPLLLAGVLLALRQHLRHGRVIVALDGIACALAGAAVAAFAIAPLVDKVWDGSTEAAFGLAFVVSDVVLIAASLGALAVVGRVGGRYFVAVVLGMLLFSVGDIVYAYQLAFGTYRVGTWVDTMWIGGLVLVATGASTAVVFAQRRVPTTGSLVIVTMSSAAAVTVLSVAPDWGTNPLPSVLALCALASGAIRFALVFLQLRELAVVRQQALTDELTGAGNRRALYGRLDDLLRPATAEAATPPSLTMALIDLDHFKEVNDSYGHAAGDELLRAVVDRFGRALVSLETPHLLVRLGGDEFAVLLYEVGTEEAARVCGGALQESLVEPIVVDDVALHVQASIGMAVVPDHARTRGDLLFAADTAMYAAKLSGERVCFYAPSSVGGRRGRLETAEELYAALERDELTVDYQPILSADGDLVGAEALVRWDHPTRGRLSPAEFLEVAERYRLTPRIAHRVLDVALADLRRWRDAEGRIRMSVNVSASDLQDERVVSTVAEALLKHDVPPSALTIEITETAMMRNPEKAQIVMHALADLGVELAIDDYGTGYSSLEYLLKLPIREIKLDRAFSENLVEERRAAAIVRSTVDLTHALGLRMVAEGVEDEPTLVILRDLGCDLVQGWHLGHPMSAAAFERVLTEPVDDGTPVTRLRRATERRPDPAQAPRLVT